MNIYIYVADVFSISECAGVQMLRFAGTFQYTVTEVRSICTHSFPLRKPEHPKYASSSSNNPSNSGLRPCSYVYGPVPRIPFPAYAAGYCLLISPIPVVGFSEKDNKLSEFEPLGDVSYITSLHKT